MKIISGSNKGKVIASPRGQETRPTSGRLREALFNICRHEVEGTHFLDLFAGSGAMGLEALSRGAETATFVDNSKESLKCIQKNVETLGVRGRCHVIYGDVFDAIERLSKLKKVYGIIYADPPYHKEQKAVPYSIKLLEVIDSLAEDHSILASDGSLFLEEDAKVMMGKGPICCHLVMQSVRSAGRSALGHWRWKR